MHLSFYFLYHRLPRLKPFQGPQQINNIHAAYDFHWTVEFLFSLDSWVLVTLGLLYFLTFCTCIAYNSNKHEVFCPLSTVFCFNHCSSSILGVAYTLVLSEYPIHMHSPLLYCLGRAQRIPTNTWICGYPRWLLDMWMIPGEIPLVQLGVSFEL